MINLKAAIRMYGCFFNKEQAPCRKKKDVKSVICNEIDQKIIMRIYICLSFRFILIEIRKTKGGWNVDK